MKINFNKNLLLVAAAVAGLSAVGCGDDDATPSDMTDATMRMDTAMMVDSMVENKDGSMMMDDNTYTFVDGEGKSTVHHSGQTSRNILMLTLASEMKRIDKIAVDGGNKPNAGDVFTLLDGFIEKKAKTELGETDIVIDGVANICQKKFSEIGESSLKGKIAGNDSATDHKVWNEGDNFAGFGSSSLIAHPETDIGTPTGVIKAILNTFDAEVQARFDARKAGGTQPLYVTDTGYDLHAFALTFLQSAINYSQSADDYLDDDVDGKGLLAANDGPRKDGANDTAIMHTWDEGFGYFGSTRTGGENEDADSNGCFDVFTEINYGPALNAAAFDAISRGMSAYKKDTVDALVAGRKLIAENEGTNIEGANLMTLRMHRDKAVSTWETSRAATTIQHINRVIAELGKCGNDYSIEMHATHWSSLKGLALGFQFSRHSSIDDATFATMHTQIGDAPVLCDGDVAGHITNLEAARTALATTFSFPAASVSHW